MQVRHRLRAEPEDRGRRFAVDAHHADVEVLPVHPGHRDAALDRGAFAPQEPQARGQPVALDPADAARVVELPAERRQRRQPAGILARPVVTDHDAGGRGTRVELGVHDRPAGRADGLVERIGVGRKSPRRHPFGYRHARRGERRQGAVLVEHRGDGERARGQSEMRAGVERLPQAGENAAETAVKKPGADEQTPGDLQRPPVPRRFARIVTAAGLEQEPGDAIVLSRRLHPHDRRAVERREAVEVAVARHHVRPGHEIDVYCRPAAGPKRE